MFAPRIVRGRALLPGDTRAILLNSGIAEKEGIQVGEEVELTVGQWESAWTVVGLVLSVRNDRRENYVPLDALARETGSVNQGNVLMVTTEEHDLETQQRVGQALDAALAAFGIEATSVRSAIEERESDQSQFEATIYILFSMAAMAGLVGGIGLASTMSINVLERTREIGVMRAIGASSLAIVGMFVVEGVLVGVLSWLLAMPLSVPGARLFSNLIGEILLEMPLDFRYSTGGVLLWLLIVTALSALASLWPALRATRVSVREALAYE
jgi:putative ABC transport system permease protein